MVIPSVEHLPDLVPVLVNGRIHAETGDQFKAAQDTYAQQVLALETVLNDFKKAVAKPESDLGAAMRKSEAARIKTNKSVKALQTKEKQLTKLIESYEKADKAGDTRKSDALKKKLGGLDKALKKDVEKLQKDQDAFQKEILNGINAWKALKKACDIAEPMKSPY